MYTDTLRTIAGKKMLLEVGTGESDCINWVRENKSKVDHYLSVDGVLLIRGLQIDGVEQFGNTLAELFGEKLATYTYRSTPRKELQHNIYTATEYHSSEEIPQHNENSYADSWPLRIGFFCMVPPGKLGKTPISDSRLAYLEIPAEIRAEFERKKVMYVRNYSNIDLPWTEVFQTSEKAVVEKYCNEHRLAYEWLPGGQLRTKQINQASISHPVTGEKLWFNQAHLFHISSLHAEMREDLVSLIGEENLPRNAFFGDGTPIDEQALSIIRNVYAQTKFSFQWEKNDLLLLDNMLFTHGREPFEGPRRILVGMAKEYYPSRS